MGTAFDRRSIDPPAAPRANVDGQFYGTGWAAMEKYRHDRSGSRSGPGKGIRSRRPRAKDEPARAVRRTPGNRQSTDRRDRGLTQREVGLLLGVSERAVRAIEKRALQKLARHPDLREVWRQFLIGELTEQTHRLSATEINALVGMTRSPAERAALRKALEGVPAD